MSWFLLAAGAAALIWAMLATADPLWARGVRALVGIALVLYGISGLLA